MNKSCFLSLPSVRRHLAALLLVFAAVVSPAAADEVLYFAATDNIMNVLVQKINAETDRIDIGMWLLTERTVTSAIADRFHDGVDVRIIGDRGSIFEIDAFTRQEFYWLANQGVPIRLRANPAWYPEISHWKAAIFDSQNIVMFGSANYTPFELVPVSPTNYKDEIVLLTDDSELVNAFRTKFDRMWNDTTIEPESMIGGPPYLKNWDDACAVESVCADYFTQYPNPAPMAIDTTRLELDHPLPEEIVWGQGPSLNNRMIQEINAESSRIDLVAYRLTVENIADALIQKHQAGVPIRVMVEPNEYSNRRWPEFWQTRAFMDKLWAAGVPVKKRLHDGLTHMKVLVTSSTAMMASSNFSETWQRDHNYFIPAADKPALYDEVADRVDAMWADPGAFTDLVPLPPDAPVLSVPANGAVAVNATPTLTWNITPFAVSYEVFLGTSASSMSPVGIVQAVLGIFPPATYSWTPAAPLLAGTQYFWRVVARTNATPVDPNMIAPSPTWSFTTAGTPSAPAAPANPAPSSGATDVSTTPTLGWSPGAVGVTFNVALGTANPPPPAVSGLSSPFYQPGLLAPNTTYFWRVTAVSSGGSTPGPVWSFTTGTSGGTTATDVVLYASDVTTLVGAWSQVSDPTAAGGVKLRNTDAGAAVIDAPRANPSNYFEVTFPAEAGLRYRVWFRIHPIGDSKFNDSFFVQFSDSVTAGGAASYRIGTPGGYIVNLWTCGTCQTTGWGWQRNAYWLADTGDVWFQNSGPHTMRVQVREDGFEIDQIVISPTTYANAAPGAGSGDTTIVPKGTEPSAPGMPASPNPANGATGVATSASLSWSAANATSYEIRFGTANPPPVVTSQPGTSYSPAMNAATTYFWQIVASNDVGSTTGPVWSFTTAAAPTPPGTPASPSPQDGATGVSTGSTLSWSAANAASFDVRFGTNNPPPVAATGQAAAVYAPSLSAGTTYFWQIVAHNAAGSTSGAVWTFTTAAAPPKPDEIVIYASDVPASGLHGSWTTQADTSSPNGIKLVTTDAGGANLNNPLAAPVEYFDVTFDAEAGVPYRLWLRLRALANSKFNDAVWVQFSNARVSGSPVFPIGSTSGLLVNLATDSSAASLNEWGWHNTAYWLSQPTTFTFGSSGPQTMRVQIREDGVQIDQIVLSPEAFLSSPPGPVSNDSTIVPKPEPPAPPAAPGSPTPASGASGVTTDPTLSWSAQGASSYDVFFGGTNPPPQVATAQAAASFDPGTLATSSTYFWKVIAHNGAGSTEGPLWSFTTAAAPPPATPGSPAPADGATGVNTAVTLTWSAPGATSYDVRFGASNPPPLVSTNQAAASYSPASLAAGTTYYWQVVARNANGTTQGPVWSFVTTVPPPTEIVIYAGDVPSAALHGAWSATPDATSPNGVKLSTPDAGIAHTNNPLAAPAHYVDVTFNAPAGTPYRIWLRLKATANSKFNDAVWVQFSDARVNGASVYPMNSTAGLLVNLATDATAASLNGWGWQNGAYWLNQPTTVTFATTGSHTLRLQIREDGVEWDQIVLSPSAFLSSAPGPVTNDSTIVPRP